jgi:hypothetical protein
MNIRLEKVAKEQHHTPEQRVMLLKSAFYDVYEFDPLIVINIFHLQSSEILKNLSPELLSQIKKLSQSSIAIISGVFQEGIAQNQFIDRHPVALADIIWGIFSGIVLWEESKRIIDDKKEYLKQTLDIAFEIFIRGIKK